MRSSSAQRRLCLILLIFAAIGPVYADPQSTLVVGRESLESLAEQGKHFEVLKLYDSEGRNTLSDTLTTARSAWALGLVSRARALFRDALANENLQGTEWYRARLAVAIIELQEGNSEVARKIASDTAALMEPSELRAQLWLVHGEALEKERALSEAEDSYRKAVSEGGAETRNEAQLQLGEVLLAEGRQSDARFALIAVDRNAKSSSRALKRLMEIDLAQRDYEAVLTWLSEGRDAFPTTFSDEWSHYAEITALIKLGRLDDANRSLAQFKGQQGTDSVWYALAAAGLEGAEQRLRPTVVRARLRNPEEQ